MSAMEKAGYTVESFKPEGGARTYRLPSRSPISVRTDLGPAPALRFRPGRALYRFWDQSLALCCCRQGRHGGDARALGAML